MLRKYYKSEETNLEVPFFETKSSPHHRLKNKRALELQRKLVQKRIFG